MKKRRTRTIALGIALAIASVAHAQIPTTDVISVTTQITNQVQTMAQWAQQFEQMKQQLSQSENQLKAITGSRGMGSLMNNPNIMPSDWQSWLSDIKSTSAYATERRKYPTFPNQPKATAVYDTIAAQNTSMSDLYKRSNDRLAQVKSLMGQIDSAADPAAKTDLTNRLIQEQNAMQADQNLVAILQVKNTQDLEEARRQALEEYKCKEFKRSGC